MEEFVTLDCLYRSYFPQCKFQLFPQFFQQSDDNLLFELQIFQFALFVFSEIVIIMIKWLQDFVSSNSVCNQTPDFKTTSTPSSLPSDFVSHLYDYR